jgi:methylamine--corrinoid protein Co-methyltransferase
MEPAIYTDRPTTWANSIACQAIAANSKMVIGTGAITAAGPGTEMMYYEIASNAIATVPSGSCSVGGPRRYKVKRLLGSGLENRFVGEVSYSAASLKRPDANEIVKKLLAKYEDKITKDGGPWGYTFDEIYDLRTLTPRKEHVETYNRVKKELEDIGLEFK